MSTILLVEDEQLNQALVKAVLERASDPRVKAATVLCAPTLTAARASLAASPVDVVLLDMNLPDGNGLTLARELMGPRPRVVAVTASVLPAEREAAIEAGCDDFLDKPYAAADLVAVVARNL